MGLNAPTQYRSLVDQVFSASAPITPGAVTTGTTGATQTITVPGALVGDVVTMRAPAVLGNVVMQGEVTAANTVTVKFANTTAGSITPPAGVYTAICERLTGAALV